MVKVEEESSTKRSDIEPYDKSIQNYQINIKKSKQKLNLGNFIEKF